MPIDTGIFHSINDWPDQIAPIFILFSEGNKWLWVRIGLIALLIGMLVRSRETRLGAIAAIIAVALANETTDVLKAVLQDPRPCVELVDVNLRIAKMTSFGTASAHSANMAAAATVFALALPRWAWLWAIVAVLTGLSRIYVGVHYPSQVLFGWACGILAGSFSVWGVRRLAALLKKPDGQAHDPIASRASSHERIR